MAQLIVATRNKLVAELSQQGWPCVVERGVGCLDDGGYVGVGIERIMGVHVERSSCSSSCAGNPTGRQLATTHPCWIACADTNVGLWSEVTGNHTASSACRYAWAEGLGLLHDEVNDEDGNVGRLRLLSVRIVIGVLVNGCQYCACSPIPQEAKRPDVCLLLFSRFFIDW